MTPTRKPKIDIEITNSGSGFFGIHAETKRAQKWMAANVQGYAQGTAWTDDRRYAMDIAQGALDAGLAVV